MSGPPGTGKTLFARTLANTLQVPLLVTSVASWLQGDYLSNTLKRMERAFSDAEAAKPSKGKARRERRDLTFTDIASAIQAGRPKRDARLRHRMAVHEAGHAVAHMVLGLGTPTLVSLEAAGGGFMLGIQETAREYLRADAEAALVLVLAGRAAEEVVLGEASGGSGGGKGSDLAQATRMAAALEGAHGWGEDLPLIYTDADISLERLSLLHGLPFARQVHGHLERAHAVATALITQHRAAVQRLAAVLERAARSKVTRSSRQRGSETMLRRLRARRST